MSDDSTFLQIKGVSKRYGVIQALKDVSVDVRKGEIHAVLGENGAGKTTLMRIIKGERTPDTGSLVLDGEEIRHFDPHHAHSLGIAMVHQELAIFENMTVAENIFPSTDFVRRGVVDEKRMVEHARDALASFGVDIDPHAPMANLTLAEQQVAEILRAISLEKKLIILDEPTSGLKSRETEALIRNLKKLSAQGITILFISHRIPEILSLCDRVTILRDGQYVETMDVAGVTEDQLITRMVGRGLESLYAHKQVRDIDRQRPVLEVRDMGRRRSIQDISFSLYQGEILGVFGLEGSGTTELSKAMFGLERLDTGELHVRGEKLPRITSDRLIRKKVVYLNDNRKKAGLFLEMTATENMAAPALRKLSRFLMLSARAMREYTQSFIETFSIVVESIRSKPKHLSGGNQQKLMLSMCLGTEPDCIIVNEPTRGIDVGAKAEIHRILMELSTGGTSIVMFSSELPELISLADRVLVLKDKKLSGEFIGRDITEESIMAAAVGHAA